MVTVAPPARWYALGETERCDTCSAVSICGVAWWLGWPQLPTSFVGFECFACIRSRATSDPRDSWVLGYDYTDRDDYWTEVVGVEPRCARAKLGLNCRPTLYVDPGVHNFN